MAESGPDLEKILAEALTRTDPLARAAYLDDACGDNSALRKRFDGILAELSLSEGPSSPGPTEGGPTLPATQPAPASSASRKEHAAETVARDASSGQGSRGEEFAETTVLESVEATRTFDSGSAKPRDGTGDSVTPSPEVARRGSAGGGDLGRVIAGRYKLVAILGEGGMGTVYRAEQTEPVRRQVALKLIRSGMDSRDVLARFDAERQALALMDHPNIARVFDGGATANGQPFFAMEYVQGEKITGYCDRRRLSVQARLELFIAVCQAVQHAHQKGIIHRDLKPGNVLVTEVDGRPMPKVIDFGVAKAMEFDLTDQSLNDTGAIVGTPTYMSPEQADPSSMDIDTRTDVYALGVMLYELLVGSPPIDARQFRRGAYLEMLRMVREVEPPRPSTRVSTAPDLPNIAANRGVEPTRLTRSLRGELDWVLMKALEKDRDRRYETANGLARDLQRYLADEVVEARPPSAGYRFKKFVRRHRGQVVAASLVLACLVIAIVGTTIGLLRAEEQRGIAERRADQLVEANAATNKQKVRAEAEAKRAEANFATARALVLDLGARINQIETGQVNPKLADRARKEALDRAREQFDRFLAERPDDVSVQLQAAFLHRYAGSISRLLVDYPAAESAYAAAVKILEDLAKRFPGASVYRNELALTLSDRAMLEKRMGKLKEAAATLDRSYDVLDGTAVTGTESPYRRTLTLALIELDRAEVAYRRGQFDEFARFATRASEMLDSLKAARPGERIEVEPLFAAMAVRRRAMALRELGKTDEALAAHDDAVARMKVLNGPKASRDVLFEDCETRRERARTAAALPERRAAAAEDLAAILPVAEKLVADHPEVAFYREGLAAGYLRRGELLTLLGKPEDATAALMKSLAVSRELLDRHGRLSDSMLVRAQTYLALGRARAAAGKADEAAGHWKNAITIFELALKIDPDNIHHRRGLAEARSASGPSR